MIKTKLISYILLLLFLSSPFVGFVPIGAAKLEPTLVSNIPQTDWASFWKEFDTVATWKLQYRDGNNWKDENILDVIKEYPQSDKCKITLGFIGTENRNYRIFFTILKDVLLSSSIPDMWQVELEYSDSKIIFDWSDIKGIPNIAFEKGLNKLENNNFFEFFINLPAVKKGEKVIIDPYVVALSTQSDATAYTKKTINAAGRTWLMYGSPAPDHHAYLSSTLNGADWSSKVTIDMGHVKDGLGWEMSLWYDEVSGYVHFAKCSNDLGSSGSLDILYRRGIPNSNGTITWSAAWQLVVTGDTLSTYYARPHVTVDTDGYPWIGSFRKEGVFPVYYYPEVWKSSRNDGVWATASGFPARLDYASDIDWFVQIVPLTDNKMLVGYAHGTDTMVVNGRTYDSGWSYPFALTPRNVYKGSLFSLVSFDDDYAIFYKALVSGSYNLYLDRRIDGVWQAEQTIVTGVTSSDTRPVMGKNAYLKDLYMFWGFTSGSDHNGYYRIWDNSTSTLGAAVLWFTDNEGTGWWYYSITCSYQNYDQKIGIAYVQVNGAVTERIKYDYLDVTGVPPPPPPPNSITFGDFEISNRYITDEEDWIFAEQDYNYEFLLTFSVDTGYVMNKVSLRFYDGAGYLIQMSYSGITGLGTLDNYTDSSGRPLIKLTSDSPIYTFISGNTYTLLWKVWLTSYILDINDVDFEALGVVDIVLHQYTATTSSNTLTTSVTSTYSSTTTSGTATTSTSTDPVFNSIKIDCGTDASPVAAGWVGLKTDNDYKAAVGYGWTDGADAPIDSSSVDRGTWSGSGDDDLYRDLHYAGVGLTRILKIHVSALGSYDFKFYYGDESTDGGPADVYVEGVLVGDDVTYVHQTAYVISGVCTTNDYYITFRYTVGDAPAVRFVCNGVEISPHLSTLTSTISTTYTTILSSTTTLATTSTSTVTVSSTTFSTTFTSTSATTSCSTSTSKTTITSAIGATVSSTICSSNTLTSKTTQTLTSTVTSGQSTTTLTSTLFSSSTETSTFTSIISTTETLSSEEETTYSSSITTQSSVTTSVICSTATGTEQSLWIDFGNDTSPVQSGWTGLGIQNAYSAGLGYGWTDASEVPTIMNAVDRGSGSGGGLDDLEQDIHWTGLERWFKVSIANGVYAWTIYYGDTFAHGPFDIDDNQGHEVDGLTNAINEWKSYSGTTTVSSGYLYIKILVSSPNHAAFNGIQINLVTASTTTSTSFETSCYDTTIITTSTLLTTTSSLTTTMGSTTISSTLSTTSTSCVSSSVTSTLCATTSITSIISSTTCSTFIPGSSTVTICSTSIFSSTTSTSSTGTYTFIPAAGWIIVSNNYVNIYNLGGSPAYYFVGNGAHITGGDIFSLQVSNHTDYASANATYRKIQHLHALVGVDYSNSKTGSGSSAWMNEPSYNDGKFIAQVGFYYLDDLNIWVKGLYANMTIYSGSDVKTDGADRSDIKWEVKWYDSQDILINTGILSCFGQSWINTDDMPALNNVFYFWVDIWYNSFNGSRIMGGRIGAYELGVFQHDTFLFWGGDYTYSSGNTEQVMAFTNIKNSNGDVISSKQLDLMKINFNLYRSSLDITNSTIKLRDFNIFTIKRVIPVQGEMKGIDTPSSEFEPARRRDLPSGGFLGGIASILQGLGGLIVWAFMGSIYPILVTGAGWLIILIDSSLAFTGNPHVFSAVLTFATMLVGQLVTAALYLVTILTMIPQFLLNSLSFMINYILTPILAILAFIFSPAVGLLSFLGNMFAIAGAWMGGTSVVVQGLTYDFTGLYGIYALGFHGGAGIFALIGMLYLMLLPVFCLSRMSLDPLLAPINLIWGLIKGLITLADFFIKIIMAIRRMLPFI